jgi:hypothetical protein
MHLALSFPGIYAIAGKSGGKMPPLSTARMGGYSFSDTFRRKFRKPRFIKLTISCKNNGKRKVL